MIDGKLRTFVEVVETRSFTRAAEHLHLTQPAVTQHIKQLERYYRHSLILHPHKEFSLTKAGQYLYDYAKIQIHNEELFEAHIQSVTKPLVLGATLSIADYYLSEFLADYLMDTTKNCKIVVDNTATLLQAMINGMVDCAFVEGKFPSDLFDFHLFLEENFIPVVKKDHPLAHQTVTFSDLLAFPLFLREQGSGTRAILETHLLQTIYTTESFEHVIEIASMTMIKQMIQCTDGISFLYERVVQEEIAYGSIVPLSLEAFPIQHPMYFIYLKSSLDKNEHDVMFQTLMKRKTSTHA